MRRSMIHALLCGVLLSASIQTSGQEIEPASALEGFPAFVEKVMAAWNILGIGVALALEGSLCRRSGALPARGTMRCVKASRNNPNQLLV